MTLATYSDLVAEVIDWLDDTDLTDRIPSFVRLAEVSMARKLFSDPNTEVRTTLGLTGQSVALPSDLKSLVSVSVGTTRVDSATTSDFAQYDSMAGDARLYSIQEGQIWFYPVPSAGPVTIVYRQGIPPLTPTNPTNWLMTAAPDLYLYGTLLQAEARNWNDKRLPLINANWEALIAEMVTDGQNRRWGSAPIAPRLGRQ